MPFYLSNKSGSQRIFEDATQKKASTKEGEGSDAVTDEDRSKRAIAILLDVSESLDEEIRASTPKKDDDICSAVSTDSGVENKKDPLPGEEYHAVSSEHPSHIMSTVVESKEVHMALAAPDLSAKFEDSYPSIQKLAPIIDDENIQNLNPEKKIYSGGITSKSILGEFSQSKNHEKIIAETSDKNMDFQNQDFCEKKKEISGDLTPKIILEFENKTLDNSEIKKSISSTLNINNLSEITSIAENFHDDSQISETTDQENKEEVGSAHRPHAKSLTDALSDDIFKEIDQVLKLDVLETDKEMEHKAKPKQICNKELVVLLPKIKIDDALLKTIDKQTVNDNLGISDCQIANHDLTVNNESEKNEQLKKLHFEELLVVKVKEDGEDHKIDASTITIESHLKQKTKIKELISTNEKSYELDDETIKDIEVTEINFREKKDKIILPEKIIINTKKSVNIRQKTSRCYCEVCSLLFSDPRQYWNHRYLSHDNHEFGCSLCEKKFKKVSSLIHHTKFRHETLKIPTSVSDKKDAIFFCESCGKGFSDVQSRLLHIQNFHTDKYILCNCCHASFSNIDDLVFHAKRHQIYKDTNYTCTICNRTIFFLSNFLVHIKKHDLNIKSMFKCKMCKFQTKNLKFYKAHIVTHKRFHCPLCRQFFLSKKMLILHNRKIHSKNHTKKSVMDSSYAFRNHVKGRRLYTLKLFKKNNGKHMYTFSKVNLKRVPDPNQIILLKATGLSKSKICKEKFKDLMKTLTVSNIPEINKILYIKLIRFNEIKSKPKRRTKRPVLYKNDVQTSSPTLSKETGTTMLDTGTTMLDTGTTMLDTGTTMLDTATTILDTGTTMLNTDSIFLEKPALTPTKKEEALTLKTIESSAFKKPLSPAPRTIRKKLPLESPQSITAKKLGTSDAEIKKDEDCVKFEPGKTTTDALGEQKITELNSYKIPKKDKPMSASKKVFVAHIEDKSEPKTSTIITGDAKHLKEAKEAGRPNLDKCFKTNVSSIDKTKKSRFAPLPVQAHKKLENTKTATVTKSTSNSGQIPTIVNKTIESRNEKKLKPNPMKHLEPRMNRHVPIWNAQHGPGPFGNNAPFQISSHVEPNQSQQFFEPFGNNMAWETAAQNLLAQSFGAPQSNINIQNPGFVPPTQGMNPFGGQGFSPYQGLPQQGPFGPQFGPFGPVNFHQTGPPMMGAPQPFNVPPYFEAVQSNTSNIQEATTHPCSGCQKEFPSPKVLELHSIFCNKLSTLEGSQLVCPVCSQTFEKRTVLKQHMFVLHSKLFSKFNLILGIDIQEKRKCKVCPQVFDTKQDKEAHEQTHVFLDAFNAVKAKNDKNVTLSAPPKLNKSSTSDALYSTGSKNKPLQTASSAMTKEQLAESAKKALQQIQSPAFKKKLEQQKKQLQINLQYLKGKKAKQGPTVTSAPEKKLRTTSQPVSTPLPIRTPKSTASKPKEKLYEPFPAIRQTNILEITKSSVKGKLSDSRGRRRSHSRSHSGSPQGRSSRRSRSVSPKDKGDRRRSRSRSRTRSPRNRRRLRSESPRDKGQSNRRTRSRGRGRRSRSTSRDKLRTRERSRSPKKINNKSKEKSRSKERSQSPLRSRPKPKLNPENAAYRCSKCAMLFSNFRDYANHKETHEGSDDEESYLSLMDCPPPPPITYGGYSKSSASTSGTSYSCVVCLQMFKNQQLKDKHFCSGPF